MTSADSPIFVVGSSRSGTSLLSACLNQHPKIHIVRETHYFDDLRPRLNRIRGPDRDLKIAEESIRYFRSIDGSAYGHGGDPGESSIDADQFYRLGQEFGGSPDSFFRAYCTLKTKNRGKDIWGEKTPRHVYRIREILESFPSAKIVFVVRDPRGVVASYRDWGKHRDSQGEQGEKFIRDDIRAQRSFHPYIIAIMWRTAVRLANAFRNQDTPDRVHSVCYEKLATSPKTVLPELCAFLGVEYQPEMLAVAMNNSSYDGVNMSAGISTAPVERWRQKLSAWEIAAVQRRCLREMESCGYEIENVPRFPFRMLWLWLTFPVVTLRALAVNRSRISGVFDYVRRRLWAPLGVRS